MLNEGNFTSRCSYRPCRPRASATAGQSGNIITRALPASTALSSANVSHTSANTPDSRVACFEARAPGAMQSPKAPGSIVALTSDANDWADTAVRGGNQSTSGGFKSGVEMLSLSEETQPLAALFDVFRRGNSFIGPGAFHVGGSEKLLRLYDDTAGRRPSASLQDVAIVYCCKYKSKYEPSPFGDSLCHSQKPKIRHVWEVALPSQISTWPHNFPYRTVQQPPPISVL